MVKNVLALAALVGAVYSGNAYAEDRVVLEGGRLPIAAAKAPSRTGKACAQFYGENYACVAPSVADKLGLTNRVENKDRKNYAQRDIDACPSQQVCAGPIENQEELRTALETAQKERSDLEKRIAELEEDKKVLDDFDTFVLGLKENCRGAYDQANEKLNRAKSDYSTAIELSKKVKDIFSREEATIKLTPGQALQSINLPETPAAVGDLIKQYDATGKRYEKSKAQFAEEMERLKKEGCGQTTVVKGETHFVVSPFAQYAFSADAENQGRAGVFAGYQTGRWTFGARAAAILQSEDTDSDTDKNNVQTAALPGGVQKITSDITETAIEEKDFAAVGPAVTYSVGRIDLGAGVDALVGQRRITKDYTGYLELTKDGQTLDGKKQVNDSTTETETTFGAYPHVNFDVRLWKQLYGGLEGGYNTRSGSAQGAFELKYNF